MKIKFAWYDMWVGAYWDHDKETLYVCPLPMVLIEIPLRKEPKVDFKYDSFPWKGFLAGGIAVHCDNEGKAKDFLKECSDKGMVWNSGASPIGETHWYEYGLDTCYCTCPGLGYASIGWVKENVPMIVEYPFDCSK